MDGGLTMGETPIALACPDCGRLFPPHQGIVPELAYERTSGGEP